MTLTEKRGVKVCRKIVTGLVQETTAVNVGYIVGGNLSPSTGDLVTTAGRVRVAVTGLSLPPMLTITTLEG